MHQDLLQIRAGQNSFDDQKYKSQDRDTLKSSLIDAWGHVDQNYPFLKNTFEPYFFLWTEII